MSTSLCLVILVAVLAAWLLIVFNLTSRTKERLEEQRADAEATAELHWTWLLDARRELSQTKVARSNTAAELIEATGRIKRLKDDLQQKQEGLSRAVVARANAVTERNGVTGRMEELQQELDDALTRVGTMSSWIQDRKNAPDDLDALVKLIVEWGGARSIPEHSTAYAQALKTQEELDELKLALIKLSCLSGDSADVEDAIGDIFVTLVMVCACGGYDLSRCVQEAYDEIKGRTGHLNDAGVFVKD